MEIINLILLILVFVFGIVYIRLTGGITKHIYFSYTLSVYALFLIIPAYFDWKLEKFEELGVSIESVFAKGVLFYSIGMACFVLGYIAKSTDVNTRPLLKLGTPLNDKYLFMMTIFFIVLSLSVHFSGINTSGSFITYIWTTLDFLITLIIAMYIRKFKGPIFYLLLTTIIIIFAIYFFRYRIYLTLMGLGAVYVYINPNILERLWRYIFIVIVMFYFVLFFTINKNAFVNLDLKSVEYNVVGQEEGHSVQNIVLEQGSNMHTDFTVLKYFQENSEAEHDLGQTMFIYPFVRALPAILFLNGIKPYPAPAMQVIINSYGGDANAENAGRFVSNLFEFYIAFGLPGVIMGMFFFGYILKYLQNRWVWDSGYNSIIQIAIMVSLFQYVSRGYLPQYINHISYLIAPVFLLRWLSEKFNTKFVTGDFECNEYEEVEM